MVWAAIILFLTTAAAAYVARTYQRDYHAECQRHSDCRLKFANMNMQAQEYLKLSDGWRMRYDSLVEKLRIQAAKPEDGIIHARTSGDVRRSFERELANAELKRERAEEN
jgi:hypothetical protein